jgi:hypothetical protein
MDEFGEASHEALAASPMRIARPSHDLRAAERFWVDGLGLDVLFRADDSAEGGHALLMVGWPGAAWHLELVGDPEDATPAAPTEEDLLVLYLGGEVDEDLVRRLVDAGGTRVSARNPYWDRWGITIADPDGYRLVLVHSPGPDRARAHREVAGLFLRLRERVHIQPLQLFRIEGCYHPCRKHPFEEAPDPPGTIPVRADLHERVAVSGRDRGRGDHAGAGIGLGQDPARFRLVHLHPVLASPAARGHREPRDGAGTRTTGFHPEIRELGRQETRVMIAHVGDIVVDRIRRRIDHAFGGDHDFPHAGLFITAGRRTHTRFE